jgi:hypothetical protein
VVDHAVEYVRGEVHTNGLENFWGFGKSRAEGNAHFGWAVPPDPLSRPARFRYNNRKTSDGDRFNIVVREIVGKRVDLDQLTGKELQNPQMRQLSKC